MDIIERLMDSEEYAGDEAVPQVAYDASDRIEKLEKEVSRLTNILEELTEDARYRHQAYMSYRMTCGG